MRKVISKDFFTSRGKLVSYSCSVQLFVFKQIY